MEHKVILGADKFVSIKDRFLAGKEAILVFESNEYPLDELQVTITTGDGLYRRTAKDGAIDITDFCKKANVVEIGVDLIMRSVVAKSWLLEPFVVREAFGGYELIPEVALLRKEIRTMKKIIKELNSKIKDTM